MQNNTTQKARLIMVVIMILSGILLLSVLPIGVMNAADTVIEGAYKKYEILKLPLIVTAPNMVKIFFPFWAGLSMMAGAALFFLAVPVYRGEKWGRPLALGMLAIPCVTGAYILGPIIYFASSSIIISIAYMGIGLISYFAILLGEQSPTITKIKNFVFFALLGVTIAYTFANAHTAFRMQWAMYLTDPKAMDHAYVLGIVLGFIGVAVTIIGLPLLAGRTNAGWWVTTIGTATMLVGVLQFFIGHTAISEFWIGTAMCFVTIILLVLPSVGGTLVDRPAKEQKYIPTLNPISNNINL